MIQRVLGLVLFSLAAACSGASTEEEGDVLFSESVETSKIKDEMCACKDKACPEPGTRKSRNDELTKCMSKLVALQ